MTDITNRICATCRRIIDINDLSINEGKPYHDHCLLQNTRSRITFLSDKMGRRTATVLDADELKDLLFVEERMKKDIENQKKLKLTNNDKPVFFGNTSLGKYSAMNSPEWKKTLIKHGTLKGTKYHLHKVEELPEITTEPVWEITTDENGHKGVIQVGIKPTKSKLKLNCAENDNIVILESVGDNALAKTIQPPVDYEAERIQINIWRGFELLDSLIPDSNILALNAMVAALNLERRQQASSIGVIA